jgi:hypothetical protein
MTQVDEFVSVTEAKNKLLDLIRRLQRRRAESDKRPDESGFADCHGVVG